MTQNIPIITVISLLLLSLTQSLITNGTCPTPLLQNPFDSSRYLGKWYEISRDKGFMQQSFGCTQARYSVNVFDAFQLNVCNSEYNATSGIINVAFATALCTGAQCSVDFGLPRIGDYRVLGTDYDNYAVVYSCQEIPKPTGVQKFELVWILSRQPQLLPASATAVDQLLTQRIPAYNRTENQKLTQQGAGCRYLV